MPCKFQFFCCNSDNQPVSENTPSFKAAEEAAEQDSLESYKSDIQSFYILFPKSNLNRIEVPDAQDLKIALEKIFNGHTDLEGKEIDGYTKVGVKREELYDSYKDAVIKRPHIHSELFTFIEIAVNKINVNDPIIYPEFVDILSIRNKNNDELGDDNTPIYTGEKLTALTAGYSPRSP